MSNHLDPLALQPVFHASPNQIRSPLRTASQLTFDIDGALGTTYDAVASVLNNGRPLAEQHHPLAVSRNWYDQTYLLIQMAITDAARDDRDY